MIVSTETGGLGNRLKSWVSAMRLDAEAGVFWEVTENMPASFGQLFVNDCGLEAVPADAATHKSWRLLVLPEDEPYVPEGFSTVGAATHPILRGLGKAWWNLRGQPDDRYRYMIFPKTHSRRGARADARHIDLEYERIPRYFRTVYTPLFRQIRVRPEILERVEDWADTHLDEGVIGVQVRTWRDYPRRYRKYHIPSMKRLHRLMSDSQRDERFFVVSDSDDTVSSLQEEFGRTRVAHFPRETARLASWQSPDGITEDLIDMLLLARTRRLFASYLSTFSEAAWWLGGAEARVWVF